MEHPCMSGKPCQCGGQCGCKANALEQEWFGKTAADIRRALAPMLMNLQPYVKDWNKFLNTFDGMFEDLVEDASQDLEVHKEHGVSHSYATAWGKQTYGGWESPPEYDEAEIEVPDELDLTLKTVISVKDLLKSISRANRSVISDARSFEKGLLDLFNNRAATQMFGKLFSDRLKNSIKLNHEIITN